jgi:hypothetical protein
MEPPNFGRLPGVVLKRLVRVLCRIVWLAMLPVIGVVIFAVGCGGTLIWLCWLAIQWLCGSDEVKDGPFFAATDVAGELWSRWVALVTPNR